MPIFEGTGVEPSLPEMPGPLVETVDVLAIAKVGPPYPLGQRILLMRDRHQMHVIAHQTVAEHLQIILGRLLLITL
jgi:hypothetical protein